MDAALRNEDLLQNILCRLPAITKELGSQIPIITKAATGIIGMDAHTNEIKEAKMESPGNVNIGSQYTLFGHFNYSGIVFVVGFVPGLKVDVIPLLGPNKGDTFLKKSRQPKAEMIYKFLMDIKEYTASVSDCTSPDVIIMFGDQCIDIKPVLVQMDNNMPMETVIVGEASGSSCFRSRDDNRRQHYMGKSHLFDAVALVFTKDNLATGQYIFAVDGVGIKAGDSFVFYHSDSETANSSNMNAFQDLEILETAASSPHEIIGGLIFSSFCPGGSLPGCHYNESWPISINYPGIPVAGVFCAGEIARVFTSLIALDDEIEQEEINGGEEIDGVSSIALDDEIEEEVTDGEEEERENSFGCFLHHESTVCRGGVLWLWLI
ncbi:hypothetical protein LWI28_027265 [Acer negundo]|uniref:FIST C-domain domain-containing protein n=1 Tax=Acer negundo TaxID=4023 RepID=A0AAD5NTF1_ACENE|nr:hypothetical protein LWI28_027265 [Acer negundo]